MRIAIGSDHLGLELKAAIVEALEQDEHAVLDLGTHGPSPTDYPPIVRVVATAMLKNFVDLGIMVCDSGLGASIAGNRFQGVRAVSCQDAETARRGRERLDVNMICLGATEIENETAIAMVREWAGTKFLAEENDTRILARIAELEDARTSGRRVSATMAKAAPSSSSTRPASPSRPSTPAPASIARPQPPATPPVWDIQDEDEGKDKTKETTTATATAAPSVTPAPATPAPAPAPAAAPAAPEAPRPSDITAVMKVVAGIKEPDTKLIATRVLQFLRNRFPTATGAPSDTGFTFMQADQHVATVKIGRNFVELEAGPDHVPTSKLRDPEGLEMHLSLPSITKALDAVSV